MEERHALSDEQREAIADLMPSSRGPGRPWSSHRVMINGILWILRTGAPWRDLAERYGLWQTVYDRFRRWVRGGLWERILERLQARRNGNGEIHWELFCIDGSVVRAHKAAAGAEKKGPPEEGAGHALGRSEGGFGTKLDVVCEAQGWLIAVELTAGQVHGSKQFESLMEGVDTRSLRGPAKRRPEKLAGDKAYSASHTGWWLKAHRIGAVIPHRENESGRAGPLDRQSYRRRNIIERTIGWLKEFRRRATRYEKLAVHYLRMITLGMILQFLTY